MDIQPDRTQGFAVPDSGVGQAGFSERRTAGAAGEALLSGADFCGRAEECQELA